MYGVVAQFGKGYLSQLFELIKTRRIMDKDFQDRIDEFLFNGNKMSEEEKAQFLKEIEEDEENREE